MSGPVLAIDQGTTSSRAVVFSDDFRPIGMAQKEFRQHFPQAGWVEHAPADLWRSVVETARAALENAQIDASRIGGIGITNQRETTLVWDRATGEPVYQAIVWQDRRTAQVCRALREDGHEDMVRSRTGLLLDPYFSATKIAWILDHVEGARAKAEAGKLAFGTVDSWLLWRFTGGRVHATDATNASRTLLYDIRKGGWDKELAKLFRVPMTLLPEVRDCAADFGVTEHGILGAALPVLGIAGDQHAATMGQACFQPGMLKSTYGTGCFALLNTGGDMVSSENRLLTTIAYRLQGETAYALEGSIFAAGSTVQWLRDGLGLIDRADESGPLAAAADPDQHVYLVPAFTGLGAPWWEPDARGALYGLTRGTGRAEIARAALEAVCFQTCDLLDAMRRDCKAAGETELRVDGGMVASDWTMQRLADLLNAPVHRPHVLETTALGAAWLAGMQAGVWPGKEGFANAWRPERRFEPTMDETTRRARIAGWHDAVRRTILTPGDLQD